MTLINADAMVQELDERLKELYKEGMHIAEDPNAPYDFFIDHLTRTFGIVKLREWINKQPTIEAAPVRRGQWEDCSNGWMCSVCEHDARKDYSYCPNCGAKMEGKR